ncbi:MAG: hypothetical protein AAF413_01150 [Patescibacteria group bacterium]
MTVFIKGLHSRTVSLFVALSLIVPPLGFGGSAGALAILGESLTLGTSVAAEDTSHAYQMDLQSSGNIGSIEFLYCSEGPLHDSPCTAPAGLDVSGATISSQTGETGFTVDPVTTASRLVISRTPTAVTGPVTAQYIFDNVTNPSTSDISHFVRIKTYASVDATGPDTDRGAIVFSTSGQLAVGGFVPPYLTFCVGLVVAVDCSSFSGTLIDLGELDPLSPRFAFSQFAAATNYPSGYSVFVTGNTMTSGVNTIQPNASNTPNTPGVGQFGLNLTSNIDPVIGSGPDGVGTAVVAANYSSSDQFRFVPGEVVATSSLPTEFNRFTVAI